MRCSQKTRPKASTLVVHEPFGRAKIMDVFLKATYFFAVAFFALAVFADVLALAFFSPDA